MFVDSCICLNIFDLPRSSDRRKKDLYVTILNYVCFPTKWPQWHTQLRSCWLASTLFLIPLWRTQICSSGCLVLENVCIISWIVSLASSQFLRVTLEHIRFILDRGIYFDVCITCQLFRALWLHGAANKLLHHTLFYSVDYVNHSWTNVTTELKEIRSRHYTSCTIYIIIRDCTRVGAFPRAFCVPNSVALASLTLQVVYWAIH